jgi:hypothetical protein
MRFAYRASPMELDEIFSPDDTDAPRAPDTDDAFEL